jgi:DNA-binding transcriptional MerR regulator
MLVDRFEFESKLIEKQNEGELKLKEQTIISLQEKIKEMQAQIKELTQKANLAESNVKDIAVKAIESSSKIQVFPAKENDKD